MDRTALFFEEIKRAKNDRPHAIGSSKNRKIVQSHLVDEFTNLANSTLARFEKLREVTNGVMVRYRDFSSSGMSDSERREIDGVLLDAVLELEECLKQLKNSKIISSVNKDQKDHFEKVLANLTENFHEAQVGLKERNLILQNRKLFNGEKLCPTSRIGGIAENDEEEIELREKHGKPLPPARNKENVNDATSYLDGFDSEELASFQYENALLVERFTSELEEAKRIEKEANQVSQLLSTFADHVQQQHDTITNIYQVATESKDVIDAVPSQLIQAQERNSFFKKVMVFFLLFAAFLLLFLDFIN